MRQCIRCAPRPIWAAVAGSRRPLAERVAGWSRTGAHDWRAITSDTGSVRVQKQIARLESALPVSLRSSGLETDEHARSSERVGLSLSALSGRKVSHGVLLALSRQGRWAAVVWLVSQLLEKLWRGNPSTTWKIPDSAFGSTQSLDDLVETAVYAREPAQAAGAAGDLDKCMLGQHPFSRGDARLLIRGHQALGEIWQALGYMIIDDAAQNKDSVRPEILELIALLHSHGIMPDSIYAFSPEQSHLAGTQPPTLRLLSSQIMTSLSDAAWNARQASAVATAQTYGSTGITRGPELPSSKYRIRVAGLRHEVWLELVLWSCLHGGWARYGAPVVEKLMRSEADAWSPMSWRETLSPMVKAGEEGLVDWDRVGSLFSRGSGDGTGTIERTISSEVLSAYVDAMVNLVSTGVGDRGMRLSEAVRILSSIKTFLTKRNFGLESTSWDAVVERLLESESVAVEEAPRFAESLLSLSASYGEDELAPVLTTRDEQWRPKSPYIADGSAISLGVAHRIITSYLKRGEAAGAFRAFRDLQARTDHNKRLSIASFFQSLKSEGPSEQDTKAVGFHSPVANMRHPGLFPMLPATVSAPLLDLVTDVKAFRFGSWLIASQDIDGPTVGPLAYRNPLMVPALIKFLAASGNEELLAKMLRSIKADERHRGLPADVLIAILESQFTLNNDKAAIDTFETIMRTYKLSTATTEILLAILCRQVLKSGGKNVLVTQKLQSCLASEHKIPRLVRRNIAAILMHLNDDMKALCRAALALPPQIVVYPQTKTMNAILLGYTQRHGSAAGVSLLCKFSDTARAAQSAKISSSKQRFNTGISRTRGKIRPDTIYSLNPDEFRFEMIGARRNKSGPPESLYVRGSLTLNATSVRIILTKRLQELRSAELEAASKGLIDGDEVDIELPNVDTDDTVLWAKRLFRAMGMKEDDIKQELVGQYDQGQPIEP